VDLSDFDYELPPERVAQYPADRRDASRLMVLDRMGGGIEHRRFDELPRLLNPEDLLVLNDTRVLPAKLVGHKASGGRVEFLLVERQGARGVTERWHCMLKAARRLRPGTVIGLDRGVRAVILEPAGDYWLVRFEGRPGASLLEQLEAIGSMPLPPYIKRVPNRSAGDDDRERYQTVFARRPGAVAAPTAGLHFTDALLRRLEQAGVGVAFITLHVGPGTFLPVRSQRIEDHVMHEEAFEVPAATDAAVARTRERGGRVVAIGTTVVRVLESRATEQRRIRPGQGRCGLYIYPGFRFRIVDALLTNFHLPRSTLLMLVAAFGGREHVLAAYAAAIENGYRFYSYGDAMLVTAT
jgi:S-adenosylmethionine:tRNA ribosyltransferase-isomerase